MKSVNCRLFSIVLKGCLLSTILGTTALAQANITVTSLADSGPGSLRQAIVDAGAGTTIDFAVKGIIALNTGSLVVDKNITFAGSGAADLTISGSNTSRVFEINGGNVKISNLTIANGKASGGSGGAIRNSAKNNSTNTSDGLSFPHEA